MGYLSRADKLRTQRKEALADYMTAGQHYIHAVDAISKMTALAKEDQIDKDRFSAWSAICDKHMRFVDKYMPTIPNSHSNASNAATVSALQRAVRAMASDTQQAITHNPTTSGDTAIVPTNIERVSELVSSSDDEVIPADTASVGSSSAMRVTGEDSSQGIP